VTECEECTIPGNAEQLLEDHGYFVIHSIIGAPTVRAVRSEVERIIAVEDGFQLDKSRVDGATHGGAAGVRVVRDRFFRSTALWEHWFTAEHIVEVQRRFVGDNVRLQGTAFFTKAAGIGEPTPWHQDIWLWARDRADPTRPYKMRHGSLWIALEPVDLSNGCLHLVPGSHKGAIVEHVQYEDGVHPEIPRELAAAATGVPVPLDTGDAVFWHPKMWHMSPQNTSDRTRWGGVIVSIPDAMAEGADQANRPFLLKDGKVCARPQLG
jgi:ectoine hydroxylase-related dioxygenase (phytanoyl-CoA dioxygenase family)